MQLARITPVELPALPPAVAAAAQAYQADELPVAKCPGPEIGKLFNRLLSRSALLLGHKTWQDEDELFELAASCAEMVQRRFPAFKPSEVDMALRRGASGEFRRTPDEIVYVGLQTVADWLAAYQVKARAVVVKALAAANEPKLLAEGHPDRVEWRIKALLQLRDGIDAGTAPEGWEFDPGNGLYQWIKALGLLRNFRTPEQYEQMRLEEADRLLAESDMADRDTRRKATTFAAALDTMVNDGKPWPSDHPLARTTATACMKRVLREWLQDHILEETDLDTLLREAAGVYYDSHPEAA